MKFKKAENFTDTLKSMAGLTGNTMPTFLRIDTDGYIIVESFSKLINYTENEISFTAHHKQIYIHGNNLGIMSFSKNEMMIKGEIQKIELFEV